MPKKSISKPKRAGSKPAEKFDPKAVTPKVLLGWMESRGLSEIEFENEDFLFRASKKTGMEFSSESFIRSGTSVTDSATTAALGKASVTESTTLKKILSPFVGTFYRSPSSIDLFRDGS